MILNCGLKKTIFKGLHNLTIGSNRTHSETLISGYTILFKVRIGNKLRLFVEITLESIP